MQVPAPAPTPRLRAVADAPLVVTGVYMLAGILWILFSDLLVYRLVRDQDLVAKIETAKGWAFVVATSLLIYATASYSFNELKRSEAQFRAVLNCIADGVMLIGGPHRAILNANPAALRILGVEREEDVIGINASEFSRRFQLSTQNGRVMPPELYSSQRAFESETVSPYTGILYPAAGKPPVHIMVTAAPVRMSRDGPVALAVSVMRDVTDLEKLEQTKEEFFAAAAHALKTPFTTIRAHADLLVARAPPSSQERASAAAIELQCARVDRIVQTLLLLSRMRTGAVPYFMERVNLAAMIESIVRETKSLIGDRVSAELEARPEVVGDLERLTLVVRVMLDVAARSLPGGARIELRLTEHDDLARISVTAPVGADVGFSQEDELRAGIQVAHEIVNAHGGTIELSERRPGAETTSWFELHESESHG